METRTRKDPRKHPWKVFENRDPLKGDGNSFAQVIARAPLNRPFENRDPLKGDGNWHRVRLLGVSSFIPFENRDPLKGDGNLGRAGPLPPQLPIALKTETRLKGMETWRL